jgi:hypothetical protein
MGHEPTGKHLSRMFYCLDWLEDGPRVRVSSSPAILSKRVFQSIQKTRTLQKTKGAALAVASESAGDQKR